EGVVAEGLVVVEVLVATGDAEDALGQKGALGVGDEVGIAGVGEAAVQGVQQAEAPVGLAEEQGAGVGGQGASGEVGLDAAAIQGGEGEGSRGTLCHGGGPLVGVVGSC